MDETAIPENDQDAETRMECMAMATVLNQLRDTPKEDMASVIDDAALVEFYVNNGHSVAVYCATGLAMTIRG